MLSTPSAAIRCPSAGLPSPSSVPTVNPANSSPLISQSYLVTLVAINETVKTFDGLDYQHTAEEFLYQIDAHAIFNKGEQSLDFVAYYQWHSGRTAFIQYSLSGTPLSGFLRILEN